MRKVGTKAPVEKQQYETPDDLSIPDFLRRTTPSTAASVKASESTGLPVWNSRTYLRQPRLGAEGSALPNNSCNLRKASSLSALILYSGMAGYCLVAWSFDFGRNINLAGNLARCLAGVHLLPKLPGDTKRIDI
jgi:hypothetical protein